MKLCNKCMISPAPSVNVMVSSAPSMFMMTPFGCQNPSQVPGPLAPSPTQQSRFDLPKQASHPPQPLFIAPNLGLSVHLPNNPIARSPHAHGASLVIWTREVFPLITFLKWSETRRRRRSGDAHFVSKKQRVRRRRRISGADRVTFLTGNRQWKCHIVTHCCGGDAGDVTRCRKPR